MNIKFLKRSFSYLAQKYHKLNKRNNLKAFYKGGMIPWSKGYQEYKWGNIKNVLLGLETFNNIPEGYGYRIDERIIEYPWVLSRLKNEVKIILDAGSTFNFKTILVHPKIISKEITICTQFPESKNFIERKINYVFADLRNLPFRDNYFESIVSISTIEHIGMNNSIYGVKSVIHEDTKGKSFTYLDAIKEFIRILKSGGQIFLTAPFGIYENHEFFQQFDSEMLNRIKNILQQKGKIKVIDFYKYEENGWIKSTMENCQNVESYNPHTGKGKGNDHAAHCRSVFCLEFIKNN